MGDWLQRVQQDSFTRFEFEMSDVPELTLKHFTTPEHKVADEALRQLAVKLNRASVLIVLKSMEIPKTRSTIQSRVVCSHILSAVNTLSSILRLTETLSLQVREAVALARAFYETCLVGSFCSIDGGDRANRAELYSIYKTFKTQTKHHELGSLHVRISRSPRLDRAHPKVKEALALFDGTSRIRPCFVESRDDMIAAISAFSPHAGIMFRGAEGMIFELSSEIIHGSYHGFELFHSLQNRKVEAEQNMMAHYEAVFFTLCFSIAAFAKVLNQHFYPSPFFQDLEKQALDALKPFAEQAEQQA